MQSTPQIDANAALQNLNTFGIAAYARYYLRVTEADQLHQLAGMPELRDVPRLVLGGGSNLILSGDFPGLVLHMALMGRACVAEDDQCVVVQGGAGESWHEFVLWTVQQGWGGLENLSLIPGCVGAAPIQNIGAYGVELKDVFHSLSWYEFATGVTHNISDCRFGYRDSIFKHELKNRGAILNVRFRLPKRWHPNLAYGDVAESLKQVAEPTPFQVSEVICAIRRSKLPDPAVIGNVGSFFKNPLVSAAQRNALHDLHPRLVSYPQPDGRYKLAAGWLIEQTGWKGRALERVGMYQKQALVMVNLGGASGSDVLKLAQTIQADVFKQFGVRLEVEPEFV